SATPPPAASNAISPPTRRGRRPEPATIAETFMKTVILFGVGAMGGRLLRVLENDYPGIEIVAAVDNDAAKTGKTLAEVTGFARFGGVKIAADLDSALAGLAKKPDVLVHMTESKPHLIKEQLLAALNAGLNVVSAAESMFYPGLRYAEFTAELDAAAKANGVSITGTGINPGFSYDVLPLNLARGTSAVTQIGRASCRERGEDAVVGVALYSGGVR